VDQFRLDAQLNPAGFCGSNNGEHILWLRFGDQDNPIGADPGDAPCG
jgi:hypothetical protein